MAAVDQLRNLFNEDDTNKKQPVKKDKLAETKKQEREVKAAFKAERDKYKEEKHEEDHLMHELYREERATHPNSKRAQKDARHQAKHDAKIADGQTCEHGVWKCKICFPHKTDKTTHH